VAARLRAARRQYRATAGGPARPAAPSRPPARAGPLRRGGSAAGHAAPPRGLRGGEGAGRVRRALRPLEAPTRPPAERGFRAGAGAARALGRLALPARRLAAPLRRPRLLPALAWRRDRDGTEGRVARRARRDPSGAPRRDDARPARAGRRSPPHAVSPPPGALPLRARRVQARLGARWADPLAGGGMRTRGNRPSRRHAGGDR